MYTGSVEGERTRYKSQTRDADRIGTPYNPIPIELLTDGNTSSGAKDAQNRSRYKTG